MIGCDCRLYVVQSSGIPHGGVLYPSTPNYSCTSWKKHHCTQVFSPVVAPFLIVLLPQERSSIVQHNSSQEGVCCNLRLEEKAESPGADGFLLKYMKLYINYFFYKYTLYKNVHTVKYCLFLFIIFILYLFCIIKYRK